MSETELVEAIAQRVVMLLLDAGLIVETRMYRPLEAARLAGAAVETDRSARRVLRDLGIPTVARSAGGKKRGVLGRDLTRYLNNLREHGPQAG